MKKHIQNNKGMTKTGYLSSPFHHARTPSCHSRTESRFSTSSGGNLKLDIGGSNSSKSFLDSRGMTLVELIVSMGLFAVFISLCVGFLIVISRLQMEYRDTANLQQEGRVASEIFSRFVREAKSVSMKDSSGGSVSDFNSGNGLCDGGTFTITRMDNTVMEFTCMGTPRMLYMASCVPVAPSINCTLPAASEITSAQVNVTKFLIYRGTETTYPKTLRYEIDVEEVLPGGATPGVGQKMTFPGYLVMRNEL